MELLTWILDKVDSWETHRDSNYKDKWDEYYRIWRGEWAPEDRARDSERSRFIAPATQQAIESAVSELEEATFGRGRWVDVDEDLADEQKDNLGLILRQLLEDFELYGIPDAVSTTFLNGAIYGTGIAKISVEMVNEPIFTGNRIPGSNIYDIKTEVNPRIVVKLIPIAPQNFVIDPLATSIDSALGCAHICAIPKHQILQKQREGIYRDVDITANNDYTNNQEQISLNRTDDVKITEYHGKVPRYLLDSFIEKNNKEEETEEIEEIDFEEIEEDDLVEAIVTIANDTEILKAVENPFTLSDRSIIAYQHEKVPDTFWGRGVTERGYHPQKILDAEVRARIDSLALSTYPMIAIDALSIPRGQDFKVRPGKNIFTNGDPNNIFKEFKFSPPDSQTYRQQGEMERMIQMGTGAMDSATPTAINSRNTTASGMSMINAGAIKRQKRTMQNIERNFLDPLVKKSLWRYMQFDSTRYPVQDYKFVVHSTMGIMAREFEQMQLTQLLNTVPPDSPAYWVLIKSIYENSSLVNKEEMLGYITQFLEQSLQPKEAQPDLSELARYISAVSNVKEGEAKILHDNVKLTLEALDRKLKEQELTIKAAEVRSKAIGNISKGKTNESRK